MGKFLTVTVVIACLAALVADVSRAKSFSFAAFNAQLAVDGSGVGRGKPPPEPACWDDKSGQPHCHA